MLLAFFVLLLASQLFFARLNQQTFAESFADYKVAMSKEKSVQELERDVLELQRHVLVFKDTGSQTVVKRFNALIDKVDERLLILATNIPNETRNENTETMLAAMTQHINDYNDNFTSVIKGRAERDQYFEEGVIKIIEHAIAQAQKLTLSNADDNLQLKSQFKIYLFTAQNIAFQYVLSPSATLKEKFLLNISAAKDLVRQTALNSASIQSVLNQLAVVEIEFSQLTFATRGYLYLVNVVMAGTANEFLYLANELSQATANYSQETSKTIGKTITDTQTKMNFYWIASIIVMFMIGFFIANRIIKPVLSITNVFEKLSKDIDISDIPESQRHDEIGRLANAAKIFNAKNTQTRTLLRRAQELNDSQARLNQKLAESKIQAEKANASKSIFLANMSHEIRTPMNAIIGLVDLSIQQELNPQVKEHLIKISYSSHILLNVINDILDFSKIEAGKLDIENSYFSFASLFDSLLAVASLKAAEKNLNLHLYVQPDIPTNAIGDPLRISQVVLNLVSNAIKFTQQGEVNISFKIKASDEKHITLIVEVEDTGIGMSPAQLNKVLLPFTQADSSTSREFGGTGLGLTIVTQLVKLMGGEVSIISNENVGSKFTCSFVLQQEASPHALLSVDNTFNRPISYFINNDKALLSADYLSLVSSSISYHSLEDLPSLIDSIASQHIVVLDIENGRQSRDIHEHVMNLKEKGTSIACITNTQPEQLSEILKSQWSCNTLSHPFTPTEFYLFANALYGSESFFAGHSLDKPQAGVQLASINTTTYKGHVLLVEDNSINQIVAGEMLHSFGLTYDVAEDGQQALTKVINSPYYDLILMDIQMPVLDGKQATQKIREAGHNLIPIIGLSANAMKTDFKSAIDSGMNEYLTKPIKRETLRIAIEKYLPKQIADD